MAAQHQGKRQAKGMRHSLRQGHRLLALRQRLVRIAQEPQRPRSIAAAHHTRILPIEERRAHGAVWGS